MSDEVGSAAIEFMSEFAWVKASLDSTGRGPRMRLEDCEDGTVIFLDAIELASICHATDEQRRAWLQTGPYAAPDERDG